MSRIDNRVVTYNSPRHYRNPDVLTPIAFTHRVEVPIFTLDGAFEPLFNLVFFGIPIEDFFIVPGGADPIYAALRRRGLDPNDYVASMFAIHTVPIPTDPFVE